MIPRALIPIRISYGVELARLGNAQKYAQNAYDTARRGRVSAPVLEDAQVGNPFPRHLRFKGWQPFSPY